MNDEVLEAMIKKYLYYQFQTSLFCWQGGEPSLMGLEFYEKVVALQKKHGIGGQNVSNAFQTNGLLINESWATFFNKYKFFIGLSLDGPEKIHNRYRKTKNGKPTWEKVMNSSKILKDHNVEFNILCVISKANLNHAKELYNFFMQHDFNYLQFIPALECTSDNKMASFSPSFEEYGKFLCEMFDLWKKDGFGRVYIRTFEDLFSLYLQQIITHCPFGEKCSEYFVIESNGDVFPCDFYVRPELKLGNILEDEDFENFIDQRLPKFDFRKAKLSKNCLDCHWKQICFGGCIKDKDFCENLDKNKSYFCKAYKEFFTHSFDWYNKTLTKILHERGEIYHSAIKKINRNDICPCGSGLKYKQCHGKLK